MPAYFLQQQRMRASRATNRTTRNVEMPTEGAWTSNICTEWSTDWSSVSDLDLEFPMFNRRREDCS